MLRRPAKLAVLCLSVFFASSAAAGGGSEWQDLVFPIPMRVEPPWVPDGSVGHYVKSPLKIRLRTKRYGIKLGALRGREALDDAEQILLQHVDAVLGRDRGTFSRMIRPGEEPKHLFESMTKSWPGIEEEPLHYQIAVEQFRFFALSKPGRFGVLTPILRAPEGLAISPDAFRHPITQVLGIFSLVSTSQPDEFQPIADGKVGRWLELSWDEEAGSGPGIAVGFDGAPADWPVVGEEQPRTAPAWAEEPLRVYGEAVLALLEERYEDYLSHLGPSSRQGTIEWFERLKAENRLDTAPWLVRRERRVVYAIRGEGMVLFFYRDWPNQKELSLGYSFLATTPEGRWQLVNTNSRGGIDRLLAWPPFQKALLNDEPGRVR